MNGAGSIADAIGRGDERALADVLSAPIVLSGDNLVERPWGGRALAAFKGLRGRADVRFGESFEVAADPTDPEAREHPSMAVFADGSTRPLIDLITAAPERLLGPDAHARWGARYPLLPKFLNAASLLSLQGHPVGLPEAYYVLEAAPGATVRLGFSRDLDPRELRDAVDVSRRAHETLRSRVDGSVSVTRVNALVATATRLRLGGDADAEPDARPTSTLAAAVTSAMDGLGLDGDRRDRLRDAILDVAAANAAWLDRLHAVPVRAGDVILNASAERRRQGVLQADVHALGDVDAHEVLLLEVRRPGKTHRLWDFGRLPVRDVHPEDALGALVLGRVDPDAYRHAPEIIAGRPGVFRSAACEAFVIEHVRPPDVGVRLETHGRAESLHVVRGRVRLSAGGRTCLLERGRSAVVPATVSAYEIGLAPDAHDDADAEVAGVPEVVRVVPGLDMDRPPVETAASNGLTRGDGGRSGLRFGTSGLRALVTDMTDREVVVNTRGFLRYLVETGQARPGGTVLVARDLRERDPTSGLSSSPRIAAAVVHAIVAEGARVAYAGPAPTPALAYAAQLDAGGPAPSIMITGSHIPADRNGIKFYKPGGEVLKRDEIGIAAWVARVRAEAERGAPAGGATFGPDDMFVEPVPEPPISVDVTPAYRERFIRLHPGRPLEGWRVVVHEHSSVARDLLADVLGALGAEVRSVERADTFVPVDTENVDADAQRHYARLVREEGAAALVSTDADGDRPLVVDDRGRFVRGDGLGALVTEILGARVAVVPVSSSDVVDRHLEAHAARCRLVKTRIGSPHVIGAMGAAAFAGDDRIVGWEANGGYLVGTGLAVNGESLDPLPTRDAILPIVTVLAAAARGGITVSALVDRLPARASAGGLIDGVDPTHAAELIALVTPGPDRPMSTVRARLDELASGFPGRGGILGVDWRDGVRITFSGGDVLHVRPSGNAPQLRIYVVGDDAAGAESLLAQALDPRSGILSALEAIATRARR